MASTKRAVKKTAAPAKSSTLKAADAVPARPFNVVSIDGGTAGLLSVLMLQAIEQQVPGFLASVDLFAGTSSGGITSLILATQEDPALALDKCVYVWSNPQIFNHNSIFGYLKGLCGVAAINATRYAKNFFARPDILGDLRLGDLKKKVVVVSFRVNQGPSTMPPTLAAAWGPKIYGNFSPADPDYHALAVDAAVSTSAAPVFAPIYHGHVDGGVTANNPTMCAIAAVVRNARASGVVPEELRQGDLRQIRVLSLGGGKGRKTPFVYDANWGYLAWLFNPKDPLLVVAELMRGSTEAVSYQAGHLLPPHAFFRLDPRYVGDSQVPFSQSSAAGQQKEALNPATMALVDQAVAWIKEGGWTGAA